MSDKQGRIDDASDGNAEPANMSEKSDREHSSDDARTHAASPPAKAIVALTSYAALFSPLTANIYLPAIPTLVKAFHTSTENINLTVTVYMVMQGISPMICILPETLRSMVGNGSIPPPRIYRTPINLIGGRYAPDAVERAPTKRFANPFELFLYPDLDFLLIFFALIYAVLYGVVASMSSLFAVAYPFLDETDLGLLFLAIGGGMIVGTATMGKVLDWEYRRIRDGLVCKYLAEKENGDVAHIRKNRTIERVAYWVPKPSKATK
ncbi:hypothetical protein PUNSTDRAFT_135396 [Punctularia strigosozonata HHB-11173 SS5]|uniref:uncharacterized protein n=1 Tax=Punctularia strigosozonata (strain HHB-11173) TaxID=741275 RepID=UPI000441843F|nr:uncharacterized protein PUNSTDRAFT_135396 [Punctularia strigosozonata HHB-11173 SS5]EIN07876.1 hypothetical protein PUNSTDRAFT_135396 [Punctularia strigosozonata HHB-11173 SS5]